MNERENILGRIREALKVPAPRPGHSREPAAVPRPESPGAAELRQWLPPVGPSFEERLELFKANAAGLKAGFQCLHSREELVAQVTALRDREGWTKIGTHEGELTNFLCARLELPLCRTEQRYAVAELESCSVGITQCDALVAQTGSVLLTSRSAGGRALSVLPPQHVVLARPSQLVADLPAAFELLKARYAPDYPSFISFITGASRTGDIERILVLGAHGPKKLTIFCVD